MIMLGFIPLIFETIGASLGAQFILDIDINFAIAFGFLVAAVSPGIYNVMKYKKEGYGM